MSKTKHNPPEEKKSNFIKLSKLQSDYLKELRARHMRELEQALESVYEELGILEKVLQVPLGTYQLRKDLSGLDVLPFDPPKDPPVEDPKDVKPPEKEIEPQK